MTKNQLETIVRLYAGELAEPIDLEEGDSPTLDRLVYELQSMAEVDAKSGAAPVIIVRSSQRLPWLLSIILALLVGILAARLFLTERNATVHVPTVEEEFGIKYLSPDRLHIQFTTGDIYSVANQILPRLQQSGIVTDDILQLCFVGADSKVTLNKRDLKKLPSLRELCFSACELDWDGFVSDELVFVSLESCSGLESVDLSQATQLRNILVSNCQDLETLRMPPVENRLCKLRLDNCMRLDSVEGLERIDDVTFLELTGVPCEIPPELWKHAQSLRVAYLGSLANDNFRELLQSATRLERLCLAECRNLKTLEGIATLANLEHLCVAGCPIQDWSPLADRATYVYVYKNHGEHEGLPLPDHRVRTHTEFWSQEEVFWKNANEKGYCAWK